MATIVRIDVDDPDGLLAAGVYGAGALIRLQSSVSASGTFGDVGTAPLIAATYTYTIDDPAGADTTWYRSRFESSTGALTSSWSPVFQVASLVSYASLQDLLLTYESRPSTSAQLDRLGDLLAQATKELIDQLGFDFWPHPTAGTEVRIFHGRGLDRLCVHDGLVPGASLSVEISYDFGRTYVLVDSTNWFLEPLVPEPGHPYEHIRLTPIGAYAVFPEGTRTARVTSQFGWPAVPVTATEAVVARARQLAFADPAAQGGVVGPEALGRPLGTGLMPDAMWRLISLYRNRNWCYA